MNLSKTLEAEDKRFDEKYANEWQPGHKHNENCEWVCSLRGEIKTYLHERDGKIITSLLEEIGGRFGFSGMDATDLNLIDRMISKNAAVRGTSRETVSQVYVEARDKVLDELASKLRAALTKDVDV